MAEKQYEPYIEELAPFENEEQKKAVQVAHLKGLRGQLETLRGWESAEPQYKVLYDRTFGNPQRKPDFEKFYERLLDILANEGAIGEAQYDEVYRQWEQLSKEMGS